MKYLLQGLIIFVLGAGSYYAGARYGLPDDLMAEIDTRVTEGVARTGDLSNRFFGEVEADAEEWLARFNDSADYEIVSGEAEATSNAENEVASGSATPETTGGSSNEAAAGIPERPQQVVATSVDNLQLCLSRVSNAPPHDNDLNLTGFTPRVDINGVMLLSVAATNSCLSSGFGPRGSSGKLHKGIDFFTNTGGNVIATAAGTIVEAIYRDDYGYMVVIDHGDGVYTRYAHLKRFAEEIATGAEVRTGQVLGPIGASGAYTSVEHLHYEVLTGDYDTPAASFGLAPVNPIASFD